MWDLYGQARLPAVARTAWLSREHLLIADEASEVTV